MSTETIIDQSPDTNTGTVAEVRATATMDTTDPHLMAEPAPNGYHAAIFDLSTPYRGVSRVIVSRLWSGDTLVVGPVAPDEYDVAITDFLNPLAQLGDTKSLADALERMGYTAT